MINQHAITTACALLLTTTTLSAQNVAETGSLKIRVVSELGILNEADEEGEVPLAGVIVYVPRIGTAARLSNLSSETSSEFGEWLRNSTHAKPRRSIKHEFRVEKNEIVPRRKVVRVSDRIRANLNSRDYLSLQTISNSPPGMVLPDPTAYYAFNEPEFLPVKVFAPARRYAPAWIVVLDHDLARITNAQGVARFEGLPVGMNIPLRLVRPDVPPDVDYEITSRTLDMTGHNFMFYTEDGSPQQHTISLIKSEPQ